MEIRWASKMAVYSGNVFRNVDEKDSVCQDVQVCGIDLVYLHVLPVFPKALPFATDCHTRYHPSHSFKIQDVVNLLAFVAPCKLCVLSRNCDCMPELSRHRYQYFYRVYHLLCHGWGYRGQQTLHHDRGIEYFDEKLYIATCIDFQQSD